MHRLQLQTATLSAVLLAVAACSPPRITSDRNTDIPIPVGATVAFAGATTEGDAQVVPGVPNSLEHSRIQNAIKAQFQKKGFTVVDSGKPATFNVRYFVGVKQSTSYVTTTTGVGMGAPYYGGYGPYGYGYGYGYGPGYRGYGGYGGYGYAGTAVSTTSPVTNTNVSFVVDLVEVSSDKIAWRGIYNGEAQNSPPSDSRLNSLAKSIFSTLPNVPQ
jgi:hypothetical protein